MPDLPHERHSIASATVDKRGRITIPEPVRDDLGLRPGDRVTFHKEGGKVVLEKESPFDKWVGFLEHLEGRTTDEIMEELRGPSSFDKWVGFLGKREQTPDEIVEDMRGR